MEGDTEAVDAVDPPPPYRGEEVTAGEQPPWS